MKKYLLVAGISTGFFLSAMSITHGADYTPVACSSQSFFSENTCDLCYEEKTPAYPGQKLMGMYDTWQGHDENPPIVYEDEQTLRPVMINLGGSNTKWVNSSADAASMWELTSDIPWTTTGSTNRKVVTINNGQSLKFVQQKPDTYITLESTDKKGGEIIGMMKFPLIYRYIDPNTGNESEPITHYECVVHKAGENTQTGIKIVVPTQTTQQVAPVVVQASAPTPVTTVKADTAPAPMPTPKQITETKTGPELWLIAMLALISTPVILILSKRKI